MCGIAGIYNRRTRADASDPTAAELRAMARALHHRGPDGQGLHRDGPTGLAHARLSIIDVAGGHQPLCNEDGRVWLSFNGEIFNYRALRAQLMAQFPIDKVKPAR